jgi:effector-binding domain-containing protein
VGVTLLFSVRCDAVQFQAEILARHIEQEDLMLRYEIVIKKVEPIKVASIRGVVAKPPDQSMLWRELGAFLAQQHIRPMGPCLVLYHDHKDRDWDIEVCEQVAEDVASTDRIQAYCLPSIETMACVIHDGPFVKIGAAYDAILNWLDENQYRIVGPGREVYIREAYPDGNQNDPNTMTEIQYPVEKVG